MSTKSGSTTRSRCWRGHARRNSYGTCMDCHAIRIRLRRHGLKCRTRPFYGLRRSAFDLARGRRSIPLVADLAGVSRYNLHDYCYHGIRAPRDKAAAIATCLGVPFETLWGET